jgi:O-antigen/teichoic acid export membrane protein
MRHLPQAPDRGRLIGTGALASILLLLIFYGAFLVWPDFFLKNHLMLRGPLLAIFFGVHCFSFLFFSFIGALFVAFKKTREWFLFNAAHHLFRLFLLVCLVRWAGMGIFISNGLAALLIVFGGIAYGGLRRIEIPPPTFDLKVLSSILPYSMVNFLSGATFFLPGAILPLLIYGFHSPKDAGLFYFPWMMFSVYASLVHSVNGAFFIKSSHEDTEKNLFQKTAIVTVIMVISGWGVFFFGAEPILKLFNQKDPGIMSGILKILFSSLFFFAPLQFLLVRWNIQKRVLLFGAVSLFFLLFLAGSMALLINLGGLAGVAWAWFYSSLATLCFAGCFIRRKEGWR